MTKKRNRVLVVDDDPKHLQTTQEILELQGYEVKVHGSPFGTSEIMQRWKPDLILLDVNMPALSGESLCSLIRANPLLSSIKIFFYSSNDEESLLHSVRREGADGYICKGDINGLRRKIALSLSS